MERKQLLVRMDNIPDGLNGFVYELTESQIKYVKNIGEYRGRYYVELMSDGEMLIYETFITYQKAVNQVINFVSCTAWKRDKTELAWDILRNKLVPTLTS
tara:strand:+ start:267 stop:566 length:300 start_codon:yes stop_codon:yes gene_type:complete